MTKDPPKETENKAYKEPKNLVVILNPFDALNIYSVLEYVEERKQISESLKQSIRAYKKQIETHISDEQVDDAHAEFEVRHLLGKY